MAIPLLIDTDMGIDDAAAVCLALTADMLDVRAIVGVGGSVDLDQCMVNIGRLLHGLAPPRMPLIGRGLECLDGPRTDRRKILGADGFGECDLPPAEGLTAADFRTVYRQFLEAEGGQLEILAIGPLTNLAAILTELPDLIRLVKHIYIMGGAVWTQGDVDGIAEFNFHHDPKAAAAVLSSGLPITVVPLDVGKFISLDESHVAHLAASGYRTGHVLAKMLSWPVEHGMAEHEGRFHIHDVLAIGGLLWPGLFLKTRMRLDVVTSGMYAGKSVPALGGDKTRQIDLLTAVNAVAFLENVLESLCHEAFGV